MTGSWTRNRGGGSAFMIRIIVVLARCLGRRLVLPLMYPISLYFVLSSRETRRASRRYLERALGRPVRTWHIQRHLCTFAVTLLDRIYMLTDSADALEFRLEADAHTLELFDRGPCVLLGAHVGSFEAARFLSERSARRRVRPLVYRDQRQTVDHFVEALKPGVWDDVIPLGRFDSLVQAAAALQAGDSVAMLADRHTGTGRVRRCRFLGDDILVPEGPLVLAHSAQVPALLCFGLYRGGGVYEIRVETLAERLQLDPARRSEQLDHWAQRFADSLGRVCRELPYNWFNFYDLWEDADGVRAVDAAPTGGPQPHRGR